MRKITILAALGFALIMGGCATYYNPVTERTEYTLYSESEEIEMGTAIDKKIREDHEIVPTPDYIDEIGRKVSEKSDRPGISYTFSVIEEEGVNAFAIPGGFVYLNTGLIQTADSDDELACIIGHEIAHIVARDGLNRLQKSILYSIPSQILLSRTRSTAIQQAVDATFSLAMLKYSRDEELRADRFGTLYAHRAGYDPHAMISFLEKLSEIRSSSSDVQLPFLSSHPDIAARIENVRGVIAEIESGRLF